MLLRHVTSVLCVANAVHGFRGASPFFLLSTESLKSTSLHTAQVSSATDVQARVLDGLADCSAPLYIFIEQPGISAHDLRDGAAMPNMRRRLQGGDYKDVVQIPEVMGGLRVEHMATQLSRNCGYELKDLKNHVNGDERWRNAVLTMSAASLTSTTETTRESMLQLQDALLEHRLSSILTNHTSHVLVFASTPPPAAGPPHHGYEMDEPLSDAAMHLDLKRNVGRIHSQQNEDPQAGLPLFEKYQFLSPAIFMGLAVALLLLVILNVGISAISGLEISYLAFSKEMGPQAQQKGKQQ